MHVDPSQADAASADADAPPPPPPPPDAAALLATIGEAAPDCLWVADADGRIVYVNRRWCEYTGLTAGQIDDKGFLKPVHPEDVAAFRATAERAVRDGLEFEHEFRYRRHDGVYRWCWTRSVPVRDASGAVVRRVGL